jgi:hypothetical protein
VELSSLGWIPQWFNGSFHVWPPGTFEIKWVSGVVGFSATLFGLAIVRNQPLSPAYSPPLFLNTPYTYGGPQILTSLASAVDNAYSVPPRVNWAGPQIRYATEADALAGAYGQSTTFEHPGGPLGMAILDHVYNDNVNSATPLRFSLHYA